MDKRPHYVAPRAREAGRQAAILAILDYMHESDEVTLVRRTCFAQRPRP